MEPGVVPVHDPGDSGGDGYSGAAMIQDLRSLVSCLLGALFTWGLGHSPGDGGPMAKRHLLAFLL